MTNDELKKIYTESLGFVRINSYLQLAFAVLLIIGGTLMSLFVVFFAKAPAIVGVMVILICTSIATFNGWKGYIDLKGNPIIVYAEILRKELFTAGQAQNRSQEYYLHLNIYNAYTVDAEGKKTILLKLNGRYRLSATNRLWDKVIEMEKVEMVMTPSRRIVARLSDIVGSSNEA